MENFWNTRVSYIIEEGFINKISEKARKHLNFRNYQNQDCFLGAGFFFICHLFLLHFSILSCCRPGPSQALHSIAFTPENTEFLLSLLKVLGRNSDWPGLGREPSLNQQPLARKMKTQSTGKEGCWRPEKRHLSQARPPFGAHHSELVLGLPRCLGISVFPAKNPVHLIHFCADLQVQRPGGTLGDTPRDHIQVLDAGQKRKRRKCGKGAEKFLVPCITFLRATGEHEHFHIFFYPLKRHVKLLSHSFTLLPLKRLIPSLHL